MYNTALLLSLLCLFCRTARHINYYLESGVEHTPITISQYVQTAARTSPP